MNLFEHLQEKATLHRDDVCIISYHDDTVTTYGQLWREVINAQDKLLSLGTRRLLGVLPNSRNAAALYLACLISGVEICIVGEDTAEKELERVIESFCPDVMVTTSPLRPGDRDAESGVRGTELRDFFAGEDSKQASNSTSRSFVPGRQIVATSGSTGEPKMLAVNADKLWQSAQTFVNLYKLGHANVFWNYLPMSYLGGTLNLLLIPLASGGRVVLDKPFASETFLRFFATVNRFEVNTIWLIPTVVRGLKRLMGEEISDQLKVPQIIAFIGTSASTSEERRWSQSLLGCEVYENYGLTETTFLLAEPLRVSGSADSYGMQLFPRVEVEEPQVTNTLRVKTPFLFDGYLTSLSDLPKTGPEDWFDTGDVVCKSKNGYEFLGRRRDVIKKGGTLINLGEIEAIVRRIIGNGEVAAIGVPDDFYGENYIVFYESLARHLTEVSVLGELSKFVSRTKMPLDLKGIQELPQTRSGKVDKRSVLAAYESGTLVKGDFA